MTKHDAKHSAQSSPEPAPAGVPWARQRGTAVEKATERRRNVVEDLPDWEPLPPGEILVRRPGQ